MDRLLLFYPTMYPENQHFEKLKKVPKGIIILHKCTLNDNHMIYGSGDLKYDEQSFFVILDRFLPIYLLTVQKIKIKKMIKIKTPGDIIILHKRTKNHDHLLYCC